MTTYRPPDELSSGFLWQVVCDERPERIVHRRLFRADFQRTTKDERPTTGSTLGDDQLAATLLLKRHSLIQSHDGALGLLIGRRLRSDALHPQAGSSHESK